MADLNSCSFTGRVTRDAVVESVGAKGTQITKFGIANNTGFGHYAKTNFFNVQVWGQAGAAIAQYLKKGKQVAVTGQLENQKWTGKDGLEHDSWNLTCQGVTLLADAASKPQETSSSFNEAPADANGNVAF